MMLCFYETHHYEIEYIMRKVSHDHMCIPHCTLEILLYGDLFIFLPLSYCSILFSFLFFHLIMKMFGFTLI